MEYEEYIKKAWKTSGALVISIPKNIQELHNIKTGDYIRIKIQKIEKQQNKPTITY